MAYAVKYILQFTSDRGNEVRIEVLKKDYQGEVIYKSLGGSPSLSIEQGDGAIKGSSLVFAMQADIEGELQELYTTDNKQFKVNMYRNEVLSWQGYILPELYSEEYVDAPYDVSVTATDQLATLKAITYQREDVNVSLSTIIEDILSFTQISVPVTYHQNLSAHRKGEVPMLVDSHISQAAYNGHSCYDVLNNILLSCNCCIMQINGEWLITSLTNSTTNYYTAGVTQVREHKALGQLGVGEVCPAGTLTMVNNPALKGARVEYAHMLRHSFLVNADCVDREGWNYTPDSRNPIDIPGEREAFGKIFKAYCWELHPVNIRENNSLQLWQEVSLEKDERNYYDLSVKTLFGTNAKLLLMAVTYLGSDGIERRLTSEGWIETWDKSDVNYYIQITGTNKNAGLDAIADIEQYEMSTVQFALPPVDGTMRVGFINSTTDYAEPLASAPIYVSQVYLTVSGVTGQECTTEVEPNATQEQQDVLLAYGDTFESENAYKLGLNTLKKSSGENITSWWLDNVNFSSYYDTMLQEFSRYFGVKKAQLQGIIMGKDVLSDMYADVFSGRVMRLLTAQVDLLADEASVTVEEVVTTTVDFDTVIYATNNTNSFGSSSGGGAGTSGGASSTAGESLLGVQSDGDVYVKDGRALVGSEARFEKMALPSSAPDKRAEQKTYIYSSDTSRGAIDIAKIAKYIEEQEKIWVLDPANGVVRTQYNVVSTQEIISGRRASGASSDVTGGGGISQVTAQMIVDALGYIPYSSQNPSDYITSSALNGYAKISDIPSLSGYATQAWVEDKKYLTAIPSEYITETELSNTLGGYQTKITSSNKLAYSLISGTPTLATVATSGKYSDLSGVPTSLPASDVYDWAKAATKPTYTASEVGALSTGGGTINGSLTVSRDAAVPFYIKNTQATNTINQATLRFVIGANYGAGLLGKSADSNLYRTDVSLSASYKIVDTGNYADTTDQRYLQLSGGTMTGAIMIGGYTSFGVNDGIFYLGNPSYPVYVRSNGIVNINGNAVIHAGNIGSYNAGSATKLQTARTIWGKSFDGTGDISGNLLNVGLVEPMIDNSYNLGSVSRKFLYAYVENAITNNSTNGYFIGSRAGLGATDGGALIYAYGNTPISFYTGGERMRILGNGNVLIGTITDTIGKLQVEGDIYATAWIRTKGAAGWYSQDYGGGIYMTDANYVRVYNGKGFQVDSNVLIGNTTDRGHKLAVIRENGAMTASTLHNSALFIGSSNSVDSYGLNLWTEGSGYGFIQQGRTDEEQPKLYNLCLQPFGGNVLIGTATDNGAKLQVNGGVTTYGTINMQSVGGIQNAPSISLYDNGVGYYVGSRNVGLGVTDGGCLVYAYGNTPISMHTNGLERMRVLANGNVEMYGNLTATGEVISSRRASSSDARLKDNINRLIAEDCLAMVRNLQPSSWDWKENGEHSLGFIAQDIEPLMPYAVTKIKDEVLGQRLNLQYDQFFAPIVGAIQCLDIKVNSHEDEIERLKKRVKYLENKLHEYGYNRY